MLCLEKVCLTCAFGVSTSSCGLDTILSPSLVDPESIEYHQEIVRGI